MRAYAIIKLFIETQKQMKNHQTHRFLPNLSSSLRRTAIVAFALLLAAGAIVPTWRDIVLADQYDAQINALKAQNEQSQSVVDGLKNQAGSYADAIAKLQAQINGLQASIAANQALQADLQRQIAEAQAEITRQRSILASDLKAMYVDGTPSSIEILATSKNLSEFVDKQEYRSRVQTKLQDTLKKIAELQKQLQVQKAKVEGLIRDMEAQRVELDGNRAAQQSLLNYNQAQQDAYNAQIKQNNAKVAQLRAEQAAANRRLTSSGGSTIIAGDPSHGGYPTKAPSPWSGYWGSSYPLDNTIDNWGMYNRECVSYTAWKVHQTYGYMPYWGGIGNAYEWPRNARRAGITTSSTPKALSVAIGTNPSYFGSLGHAMWVESVNDDGSIWVSQYNWYNGGWGNYSEMKLNASIASSLTYIYFN